MGDMLIDSDKLSVKICGILGYLTAIFIEASIVFGAIIIAKWILSIIIKIVRMFRRQ